MSYKRKQEEKRRLKKLYEKTKYGYCAGAWYDERKKRIIRYSCHIKSEKKWCKRLTRRKLNRLSENYSNCAYKKIYDYWWQIL